MCVHVYVRLCVCTYIHIYFYAVHVHIPPAQQHPRARGSGCRPPLPAACPPPRHGAVPPPQTDGGSATAALCPRGKGSCTFIPTQSKHSRNTIPISLCSVGARGARGGQPPRGTRALPRAAPYLNQASKHQHFSENIKGVCNYWELG